VCGRAHGTADRRPILPMLRMLWERCASDYLKAGAQLAASRRCPRMLPKSTERPGLADGPKVSVSEVASMRIPWECSTSEAAGGIRLPHGNMVNTQLALRSPAEFTTFGDLTGSHCGLS